MLRSRKTNFIVAAVGTVLFLNSSQRSIAGITATTAANGTATVVVSITLTKTRDLAFGFGVASDPAKTVLATDPTYSASFKVTGQASTAYNITLPAAAITLTSGTNTISVSAFTSSPATPGLLSAGGTQTLTVGATRAALTAAQASGTYAGTFNVTVAY